MAALKTFGRSLGVCRLSSVPSHITQYTDAVNWSKRMFNAREQQ